MKHKISLIVSVSSASIFALTALAQEQINPKTDESKSAHQWKKHSRAERLRGSTKASDVIGKEVQDLQNERLGKVDDLALDVESGRIVQVILSTGGVLGVGSTLTAVPPGAFHYDAARKVLHLDITKEKLKAAPGFDVTKWDEVTQSNRVTEVYGYYGERPYFAADRNEFVATNNAGTVINTLPRSVNESTNTIAAIDPGATQALESDANENAAKSSRSSLGYVQKASKLMGTSVNNMQSEKLGKVENFTVDLSTGRIIAVIISSGGFLGLGDELSAVPPTAFRFDADHATLQLDASKEMLAGSPHFKANEWPDLSQPGYAGDVYRAYKVEPYFITNTVTDADNTSQNVRDRDSQTLTPLDQGNSKADINTTAVCLHPRFTGQVHVGSMRSLPSLSVSKNIST